MRFIICVSTNSFPHFLLQKFHPWHQLEVNTRWGAQSNMGWLTVTWDSAMESNNAIFKSDVVFYVCLRANDGVLNIATRKTSTLTKAHHLNNSDYTCDNTLSCSCTWKNKTSIACFLLVTDLDMVHYNTEQ